MVRSRRFPQFRPGLPVYALLLFFLGMLILYAGVIEPRWLAVHPVIVSSREIPPGFDGTRIVFVADIHRGPYLSQQQLIWLVDRINSLKPDIVILGGDMVYRSPQYIRPCYSALEKIKAPLGRFGVLGNHDHMEGATLSWTCMKLAGFTPLDNHALWIARGQDRIRLGGVGDLWKDTQDIRPTLRNVRQDDYVILVSHNPDYAEQIRTRAIDLVLSGHTHGGQITLFGLWAPHTGSRYGQKYRCGMVKAPFTRVFVSKGVGMAWPPFRFCARPDIVVITLRHSD
jgi:predicted MPP superfamily phosphohydrolase